MIDFSKWEHQKEADVVFCCCFFYVAMEAGLAQVANINQLPGTDVFTSLQRMTWQTPPHFGVELCIVFGYFNLSVGYFNRMPICLFTPYSSCWKVQWLSKPIVDIWYQKICKIVVVEVLIYKLTYLLNNIQTLKVKLAYSSTRQFNSNGIFEMQLR